MRTSTMSLLAVAAGFVAAQNTTNSTLDIGVHSATEKSQWCESEYNTCPLLCGGSAFTANNTCYPDTLIANCTCNNGSVPFLEGYQGTLAFFICQAEFAQCVVEHPNDAIGQGSCKTSFVCGQLNASSVPSGAGAASTSSSSMSSTSMSMTAAPTASGTGTAGAAAATSTSKGAAMMVNVGGEYGTGLIMGGLFGLFGLLL